MFRDISGFEDVPLRATIENLGGHVYWEYGSLAIVHLDGEIAEFYDQDVHGSYLWKGKMYVRSEYLFALLAVKLNLGKGWEGRIERDSSGANQGRKHVHVQKNGEHYAQCADGAPHDKNNTSGNPPNHVKKTLKEKYDWDWDQKQKDWLNKIEIQFWDYGVEILYPNGRTVTVIPDPRYIYYPSTDELLAYYFGPTTIDLRNGNSNGGYIPGPGYAPLPEVVPVPVPATV